MTRKNIANAVADEVGFTQTQTKQIVQKILDAVMKTLVDEGRVELRNFGVFTVKWREPRKARNPLTGEKVTVPGRCAVTFKPGQVMGDRVAAECRRRESPG